MTPRWSTASIRVRLTAWYAVVLALMLVVYATATFVAVRHEFFEQFDDQLHDDFEAAEGWLTPSDDGRIAWSGDSRRSDPDDDDEDRGSDVWLANGEQVYRSGASASLPPVALAATSAAKRYESIVASDRPWRTLTGTTLVGGRAVVLRVSRAETRLRTQLWEILVVLVLGLPVVVVLAGFGGYVLARRALTPIDQLASEARRITAERLHERPSVPNQHDEIGRLAAVINEAFARLESSFDQLRRFTADASHDFGRRCRSFAASVKVTRRDSHGGGVQRGHREHAGGGRPPDQPGRYAVAFVGRRRRHGAAVLGIGRARTTDARRRGLARHSCGGAATGSEARGYRWCPVRADRLVLREAITNVLDNAIKYSPLASTIDVCVRADGDRALLTVADQGPGIALEHRERIFDRFFRIDEGRSRDEGGTGLGLAIAKWAVEANGGHITVGNGADGGSVFRIALPLADGMTPGRG
jgi:signal transduction histidine kinase